MRAQQSPAEGLDHIRKPLIHAPELADSKPNGRVGAPSRVTVAEKPSDDLAPGTLRSIEKQSGVPLR